MQCTTVRVLFPIQICSLTNFPVISTEQPRWTSSAQGCGMWTVCKLVRPEAAMACALKRAALVLPQIQRESPWATSTGWFSTAVHRSLSKLSNWPEVGHQIRYWEEIKIIFYYGWAVRDQLTKPSPQSFSFLYQHMEMFIMGNQRFSYKSPF